MGFYATADVRAENRYYPVFRTDKSENRLTTIESLPEVPGQAKVRLEFTYDYMGRRVTKTVFSEHNGSAYQQTNEVTFVYDGWNLIAALDEDLVVGTTSTNFYLWGLDLSGSLQGAGGVGGLLATCQDGASYFACMDGNGNVMGLVDATDGTLAGEYEYGPFGEPLKALGDAAEQNAVRFSSKYTDAESGLLYYGYRYLDPSTGRWPSRDPIGESGGANLYGFVGNEPVGRWDRLGRQHGREPPVRYDFSTAKWRVAHDFLPAMPPAKSATCKCTAYAWGMKLRLKPEILQCWEIEYYIVTEYPRGPDIETPTTQEFCPGDLWLDKAEQERKKDVGGGFPYICVSADTIELIASKHHRGRVLNRDRIVTRTERESTVMSRLIETERELAGGLLYGPSNQKQVIDSPSCREYCLEWLQKEIVDKGKKPQAPRN